MTFNLPVKISGEIQFIGKADAFICTTSLRNSRKVCCSSDVLDSWDFQGCPVHQKESTKIRCHHCYVLLFVEVLLFFVEVDQFLVQQLIEQLEFLVPSLDIDVFLLNRIRERSSQSTGST